MSGQPGGQAGGRAAATVPPAGQGRASAARSSSVFSLHMPCAHAYRSDTCALAIGQASAILVFSTSRKLAFCIFLGISVGSRGIAMSSNKSSKPSGRSMFGKQVSCDTSPMLGFSPVTSATLQLINAFGFPKCAGLHERFHSCAPLSMLLETTTSETRTLSLRINQSSSLLRPKA